MPILKNKMKQRIQINLLDGNTVGMLAEATAEISEKDLESEHLHGFLNRGDVVVLSSEKIKNVTQHAVKKTHAVN
jgi:hypothetical protein